MKISVALFALALLALPQLATVGCAQTAAPAGAATAPATLTRPTDARNSWQPVPLITAAQKADPSVQIGGEGAQWARAVAWSHDARLALWGTDVGGLFRTLDEGATWEPCNVGYTPRGTAGLAIDPHNSRRVISIGANSVAGDFHGPWLSEDGAASWRQTFKANIAGSTDDREQLAFDASTYDAAEKLTRVVYWSRLDRANAKWGTPQVHPALYKSDDGGRSWAEVPDSAIIGGSQLKVAPVGGAVYAANARGLFVSRDGGQSWTQSLAGEVTGVDVSRAAPTQVWASRADGVWLSKDSGASWAKLPGSATIAAPDAPLRNVHVSPADADHLVVWRQGKDWNWPRFSSRDGGQTWTQATMDKTLSFLPTNARQGLFAWHPRDANVLLSTGGDYPTISRDGGRTYAWTGDGVNNILTGKIQFNARNPDLIFVSSQDYNGASTTDGGQTWTYQNPSGKSWGGFTYGGYAATPDVMVVGDAAGWGAPRELTVSRDGGQTWTKTGLSMSGPNVSLGDPTDARVIFASNLRSGDGAQSWAPMEASAQSAGCDGVFTFNARTGELWGIAGKDKETIVVASSDKGLNWRRVAALPYAKDLAIDARDGKLWAATDALQVLDAGAQQWRPIENLPLDRWGAPRVRSVALDPGDPDIVYVATNRDVFSTATAALRSRDGGKTWENLTRQAPLDDATASGKDGGRETFWVRVHPRTRQAWFVTSCYGIWKIGSPRP